MQNVLISLIKCSESFSGRVIAMKRRESGFTLIELLIVIAIIGVLAVIAIPSYQMYKVLAHDAAAHSDLRNFITAQEAYYVDYSH